MAEANLLLTFDELISSVEGTLVRNGASAVGIYGVATDSRAVGPGFLFVPLMGEFQDGHEYITAAVEKGATCVFVDRAHAERNGKSYNDLAGDKGVCIISVANTLYALQDAARAYVRKFPRLRKIGITGSSGKTTTKEIIGAVFGTRYNVVMNEGNLNSETGLPLSVFKIRESHDVGIFELGMNRKGEMKEIARVLNPDLALITNIGTAHIGILGSKAAIAEEKKAIFDNFSKNCVGFVPENDEWTDYLSRIPSGTVYTYGPVSTAGIESTQDRGIDGSLIGYRGTKIAFPLPGAYNLSNAIAAIALASHAGLTPPEIKRGIESVKPLFGRAQIIRGARTVIVDCYNANPDSMEKAIDFTASLSWKGKKILVIGSMLELGSESKIAHERICAQLASSGADMVFLFGEDIVSAGKTASWEGMRCESFTDIDKLNAALRDSVGDGDLVFLKGSRGMALERTLPAINADVTGGLIHA